MRTSGGGSADGSLAIYVRTVDEQLHVYTWRGRWRAVRHTDVVYTFNESVPVDLLTPILPYFPTSAVEAAALPQFALEGGVPRPLSAPLMTFMLEFEKDAREFHVKHAEILDDIYNVLAQQDTYLVMTMDEVIKKALQCSPASLNKRETYAVHKALQRQRFYIVPNHAASTVESYRIRSKKQSKIIDDVVQWTRLSQEHDAGTFARTHRPTDENFVELFAKRARVDVEQSRKVREPTKSFALGPSPRPKKDKKQPVSLSYSKTQTQSFSLSDRSIVNFLFLWVLLPSNMVAAPLHTAGSTILRATGLYEDYPHNQATAYLLLQELGILSPWENLYLLSEQLELPGHGFANESDRLSKECRALTQRLPPTLKDTMQHMRKDWGDLPVLCIDSSDAAEIDDGISIEPVAESSDTFWIRVHVANPSAFIRPDTILGETAAHLKRSFYSIERVYPMLPPTISESHFSLGPGRPTFTVSAKVNMDGDILDTEVANGRINNVAYTTPESVQKLFGIDRSRKPTMDLIVGDAVSETKQQRRQKREKNEAEVPQEYHEPVRTLEKLLAARRDRRVAKGAVDSATPRQAMPSVSVGGSELHSWSADLGQGNLYRGDPTIRLSHPVLDPFEVLESTKYDLVSHAMVLAGEVVGQWCMERGIPALYSATSYPPDEGPGQSASVIPRRPKGFSLSKPTPHAALGMDQYVKCTSPLRRYTDLMAHWQIEAYLRDEEELPFSEGYIDSFIGRLNWQDRVKTQAESRSRDFWICQLFHRALNFKEIKLPETFQCLIVTVIGPVTGSPTDGLETRYLGAILPFRQRCLVDGPEGAEAFKAGDLVDIKLTSVDVYNTVISAEAVRLVKRPKEGTIPIDNLYI